jgi:hypothetical protein
LDQPDRYAGCVRVETKRQAQQRKELNKREKKSKREFNKIIIGLGADERLDIELARMEREKQRKEEFMSGGFEPRLISSYRSAKNLPFVFDAYESTPLADLDLAGARIALPEGTERKITSRYQQVTVPAQEKSANLNVHPVMVESLDPVSYFRVYETFGGLCLNTLVYVM